MFLANDGKGINLSTNDSKDDVKGCNGSATKRSIVLMKQKLCFRITVRLGNSKRQHCSQQEIIRRGPTVRKNPRENKGRKGGDFLFAYKLYE